MIERLDSFVSEDSQSLEEALIRIDKGARMPDKEIMSTVKDLIRHGSNYKDNTYSGRAFILGFYG